LDEAVLGVGRQIIGQVVRTWLGARRAEADRNSELVDLLAVSVADSFHRRRLVRQLEDIGDQAAARLKPLCEHEFRQLPENERLAALHALTDALATADLGDRALFDADADPMKVALAVRQRVPKATELLSEAATAFYDALLDASCIALVRIVRELPAFQPRAMVELLGRMSRIADQIGDLSDRLPRTSLTAPAGTTHDDEFGRRYLHLIGDSLDDLELFGVDVRRYRLHTRVSVAYLSLTVSGKGGSGRARMQPLDDRWFDDRHNSDASMRVEAALAERPWTLLRGEAGSGKTTLLQWLAVNCARRSFTGGLASWNGRTPFLIKLRRYPDGTLPAPEAFLDGVADQLVGLMPPTWVHRRLDDSALLLVDGVDELAPRQRPKVRRWLRSLRNGHPELPIVVTSRPSAASQSWLTDLGFESVLLEPMGPADVAAFCAKWHAAVQDAGRQDPACMPCSEAELAAYETALLRNLDGRRDLRALASNPLLCAMLCALNLDRHRQLPPDRMALYEAALKLLIERRDAEREVRATREIQLDTRSKLAILQRLAWNLTLAGKVELALDEAKDLAAIAIQHLPNVIPDATDPAAVIQYLLDRSGVIRNPAEGRVDFVHRTFQEYLAARQAIDEHQLDLLVRHAPSDQWRETVIMATGHATSTHRQRLLNKILDRADTEPKHTRRLRLLAAACLEAGTIDPTTTERIDTGLGSIIPPGNSRESRSLSLGGDRTLRNLPTTLDDLGEPEATACVRTAALINGPAALRLLAAYAPDPRGRVQEEIANVWRYFDAEEYASKVLTNAPLKDGSLEVTRPEHVRHASQLSQLTALHISLRSVEDLSFLAEARHLTYLNVTLTKTTGLDALNDHTELNEVRIHGPYTRPENLTKLLQLEVLGLFGSKIESIDFMSQFENLRQFVLHDAGSLTNLHPLAQLKKLKKIYLFDLRVDPVPVFSELDQLSHISVRGIPGRTGLLRDIAAARPTLTTLFICGDANLTSIAELKSMPELYYFGLQACPVSDVAVLAELRKLRRVELSWTKVTDVRPLAALPELRQLELRGCPPELDLSPLSALPRRIELRLLPNQQVLGLDAARSRLRIKRW
jgi:hypothetical protein